MTIDTIFLAFDYFFSPYILELLAVAFWLVFILIILYYVNK